MSKKTKDVIILICISAISAVFFFFCSCCEFADHQAYESGEICECHGEFGFEYTEFFIRGLVSVISGMIIVFLRIVLDKKTLLVNFIHCYIFDQCIIVFYRINFGLSVSLLMCIGIIPNKVYVQGFAYQLRKVK